MAKPKRLIIPGLDVKTLTNELMDRADLTDRERTVLRLRLGIGTPALTLEEVRHHTQRIGDGQPLGREGIRQAQNVAQMKILRAGRKLLKEVA